MDRQKVVGKQMQRQCGGKINLAPRKAQTQPNEAAHLCADGQDGSLRVGRANENGIGLSTNRPAVHAFETTRTISLAAGSERRTEVFDLPTVINVCAPQVFNDGQVRAPTVAAQLKAGAHSLFQVVHKIPSGLWIAFAKSIRGNQFVFR